MPSRVSTCIVLVTVSVSVAVIALIGGAPRAVARPLYADGQFAQAHVASALIRPARLSTTRISSNQIMLRWSKPAGRPAGYGAYLNGKQVATVRGTRYRFRGLKCATSYTLGVSAYNSSGRQSSRTIKSVRTAKCSRQTNTTNGVLQLATPTATNAGGGTASNSPASGAAPALTLPPVDVLPPAISGNAQVGSTLTSSTGTWLDSPTGYTYQWLDCNTSDSGCANINGATASSYTLAASDAGKTVDVVVTASNSAGSGSASGSPTSTVTWATPQNTGRPSISGSAHQGSTLSTSNGTWSNDPTSFGYQWQDCNSSGSACANISGATGSTYVLSASDFGHTVDVVVTASNSAGSAQATSAATAVVTPPAPVNSTKPMISGTAQVGNTLTSSTGTWSNSPTSFGYQWQDCNSSGSGCANISGATGSTYVLSASDVGHTIDVVVTASNVGGSGEATSAATSVVIAQAPVNSTTPTISGTAQAGNTLTSSTGTWSNGPTSYAYQWRDCDSSGANCANISGATSSSYALGTSDVGHTIDVVVTASNSGGSGQATSAQTSTVTPATGVAPVNAAKPMISGNPQVGSTLSSTTGTWSNSPTSYGYQWRDCDSSGASCSNIGGANGSSYVLAASDVSHTVDVVVTATNAGGSGSASSAATAVVSQSGGGGGGGGGGGSSLYVAQSSAGTGDGSSCGNALSASWFNSSANWGSGAGKIGPGVTVHLCGAITSPLSAQGSGTSGSPITILWEQNASLSEPYCPGSPGSGPGCFSTNGKQYLTLNGGQNGSILSTANGTNQANQKSAPHGIWALNCTGCTIENLNVSNMYQEASESGDCHASDAAGAYISGSNLTIANNTFADEQVGMDADWSSTDVNVSMYGNSFVDDGTGMNWIASATGGSIGPILFYDNTMSGFYNWYTGSSACYHMDGIHCWNSPGLGGATYSGIYMYDNTIEGGDEAGSPGGNDMTADIFLEGGSGSGATVCATSTSPIYIFNNVLSSSTYLNNGLIAAASGQTHVYNNTLLGGDDGSGQCLNYNEGYSGAYDENNVMKTCGNMVYDYSSSSFNTIDYNVYSDASSNAWVYGHSYDNYSSGGFSSWKSSVGGDAHSSMQSNVALNSNGTPQSGSPVMGAGTNLSSLCTGHLTPLCTEFNGTPRPTTGSWDAGAY